MDLTKIERILRLIMMMSGKTDYTVEMISNQFDISARSVYRYIETLRDAGFVIEKKKSNLYKLVKIPGISIDFSKLIYFSEEEALIINTLIGSLSGTNAMKANLQKKLSAIYNLTSLADIIADKTSAENVEALSKAISSKKKVLLKDYESANSDKISDRLVEPFAFTTNYIDVWAYDIEKKENRIFKISRISSVQMTKESWEYELQHYLSTSDCFRMNGHDDIPIKLRLSLRAKNLLLEEYPLAEKFIRPKDKRWVLETHVHDLAGVGRFVLGLAAEIEILNSPELEEYVYNYALEHIIKRKRDPGAPL